MATKKNTAPVPPPALSGATTTMSSVLLTLSTSYTSELHASRARLDRLIGDKHWLSVGTYKEALVRRLLGARLPKQFEVGTGFVVARHREQRKLSRQLDVLVWDSSAHAPLFRDGDFVVIVPEACVAAIEVKGNLTKKELRKGIANLDSVVRCFQVAFEAHPTLPRPPVLGILAFEASPSVNVPNTILDEIGTYYGRSKGFTLASRLAYSRRPSVESAWSLPWINSVVVLGKQSIMLERWSINASEEPIYAAFNTLRDGGDDAYGFLERQVLLRALDDGTGGLYGKPGAIALLLGPERQFPITSWMLAGGNAATPIQTIRGRTDDQVRVLARLAHLAVAPTTRAARKKPAKAGRSAAPKKAATRATKSAGTGANKKRAKPKN